MTTEAATIWNPTSGEGEFTSSSANNIDDASGNTLADSSSNLIADSGGIFTSVSSTFWSTNDGS